VRVVSTRVDTGPEDPLEVLRSLGMRSDVAAERIRLAREALDGRDPAAES
jgi:hypothetical protein